MNGNATNNKLCAYNLARLASTQFVTEIIRSHELSTQ